MITKERLEELIKRGATIWDYFWGEKIDLRMRHCEIVYDHDRYLLSRDEKGVSLRVPLDNLCEDVEEGIFSFKYKSLTRLEELNLPTWKEFNNIKYFIFNTNEKQYLIGRDTDNSLKLVQFEIVYMFESLGIGKAILKKRKVLLSYSKATEQNYLKICEKCRYLFGGMEK